jgi:PleD family two-component response regulator
LGDLSGDPDSELAWLFERIRFARANYNAAFRLNAASAAWRTPGALCSRMVFTQHLAEMAVVANRYELPLSLLVFRVELPPGSGGKPVGWNMAVRQSADLIARMSRAEDLASVFPGDVIILGMPGAAAETARVAADRAASVAESTMFISSEDAAPVLIARFVCEKAAGEDGPSLLKRALTMSR